MSPYFIESGISLTRFLLHETGTSSNRLSAGHAWGIPLSRNRLSFER